MNETKAAAGPSRDGHETALDDGPGRLWPLVLGALGVVFGDIGTSVLYAFRESLAEESGLAPSPANVLGVLSLITWSLILVISIKYVLVVMRAHRDGEGGILALTSLVPRTGDHHGTGLRRALILMGIFGTALLYGDGVITPAISVLSALEGIELVVPAAARYVVPGATAILVVVFLVQSQGTTRVGRVFGPVMLLWFTLLGVLGITGIVRQPQVLGAVSPTHAVAFFVDNGWTGYLVLGAVFLVVTGGEALYADMGHFGARPIRWAWFGLVLPGLLLNYYGQGAVLLADPTAITNPFYHLGPDWATIPMVVVATGATVIASQALITGAFSLTMQAVQMGYLPRMRIVHTSEEHRGQVYIPSVNWLLMVVCVLLVVTFQSSSNLAAAYGVAVTATMAITTVIFAVVARERFGWNPVAMVGGVVAFLVIDLAFLGANLLKIPQGGWVPLVIGAAVTLVMTTWRQGRRLLARRIGKGRLELSGFLDSLQRHPPNRVEGTALYFTTSPGYVPPPLLVNLRHNNALHEQVVLVHVEQSHRPHVPPARRAEVTPHEGGFWEIVLHYGYRDLADVPRALEHRVAGKHDIDLANVTYLLGQERVLPTDRPGMARSRERLFAIMTRNTPDVTELFCLPRDRTLIIGSVVDI